MLWQEKAVRENLRNQGGKRVFYLPKGDQLTSMAKDFLARERIEILSAPQKQAKPEHMTHLNGDVLVPKTHPRIRFRGMIDTLESELILGQLALPGLKKELGELLDLAREVIRCDVLERPMPQWDLLGLAPADLRRRSQIPQEYYGIPHFMPSAEDGEVIARLNRLRTLVRQAELDAAAAFPAGREDIIQALNRMSSAVYLLMIQEKAGKR